MDKMQPSNKNPMMTQYMVQSHWAELELRVTTFLIDLFCKHKKLDVKAVIVQDMIMWPSGELYEEYREFCRRLMRSVEFFNGDTNAKA